MNFCQFQGFPMGVIASIELITSEYCIIHARILENTEQFILQRIARKQSVIKPETLNFCHFHKVSNVIIASIKLLMPSYWKSPRHQFYKSLREGNYKSLKIWTFVIFIVPNGITTGIRLLVFEYCTKHVRTNMTKVQYSTQPVVKIVLLPSA